MRLTDDEKAMLDGARGEAAQKGMDFLVRYGEALGAENLVDVASVGVVDIACKGGFGGAGFSRTREELEYDILIHQMDADEPCPICGTAVSTANFQSRLDPNYCELMSGDKSAVRQIREAERHVGELGILLHCTCTPYQVGFVPVKGQHCAWMESSAVAYINGALGARTNCEGSASAIAAMLTGKTPNWGYHLTENRYGTDHIRVEASVVTNKDWGLLGYYIGKNIQRVPVVSGVERVPDRDMLKHFGAAAASSGGIEMYHIPGITAEANTLEEAFGKRKPQHELVYGEREKKEAYDMLNGRSVSTEVDFVMLGCPHYSLEQVAGVAAMLSGKKIRDSVRFWIFMPDALWHTAERNGFNRIISEAGGVVMRDCCPIMDPFIPPGARVMATDSVKQAHYMPSLTGIQSWFGSTAECVAAALTGQWRGELNG